MILIADKEVFPLELLDLGPCLIEVVGEDFRVEKLEGEGNVQDQGA